VGRLRQVLDRRTFRLMRDELERRFLPLARQAGLPLPLTRQRINGFEVDFYWPDLGLVSRPMGCATTAPPPSRGAIDCGTRPTPPPV
jgi:hypothetical protein